MGKNNNLLIEHNDLFFAISKSAKDAVLIMDHLGNISFWNDAAEKMFSYESHEIIGKNLHDTLAPERFRNKFKIPLENFKKN